MNIPRPIPGATVLAKGRFVSLMRTPSGWEYLERAHSPLAAVIIAVTPEGKLLLVEQTRPPIGARCIELPAGLVGDLEDAREESVLDAARRELLEETGYDAARMEIVAHGPPSPGLSSEYVVLVLARELTRSGPGGGVDGEDIVLHEIHLPDVPGWLAQKQTDGAMVDPKIFGGLWFAERAVGCP